MSARRSPLLAWLACVVWVLLGVGCSSAADLIVVLQTDLRPGVDTRAEFDSVLVGLEQGGAPISSVETSTRDLTFASRRSTRVGLFRGLVSGDYIVRVTLSKDGSTVVEQRSAVHISRDYALTVVVDRRCAAIVDGVAAYARCSGESTCRGGECVPVGCLVDPDGPGCVPATCRDDSACATASECVLGRCLEGLCVSFPNDARCDVASVCDVDAGCVLGDPSCMAMDLFADRDGDSIGGAATRRCPGPGLVSSGGDCDDDDPNVGLCPGGMDGGVADAGSPDAGPLDSDGDGIPDATDCAPFDASVGARSMRACASACASGFESCDSAVWGACDASTDCSCPTEGAMQTIGCGFCGMQTQRCEGGAWLNEGACIGAGECVAGARETGPACGLRCGTQTRACSSACMWDAWACTAEMGCTVGEEETERESCGACGDERSRTRRCGADCTFGAWSAWGMCTTGMPECTPPATDMGNRACGRCLTGTESRTRSCQASCVYGAWGPYGACTGETGCTPGTTDSEMMACGNCSLGTQRRDRTCTSSCAWGGWGPWQPCVGGGECASGAMGTEMESCGSCGLGNRTRSRTCSGACAWGAWGAWGTCGGTGACTAGMTETQNQGCGVCGAGTQSRMRTCSSVDCTWGAWGAWGTCGGCTAGTPQMQSQPCGLRCGSQDRTRTCMPTCDWSAWSGWGACVDGGPCIPGGWSCTPCGIQNCSIGMETREDRRTCDAACQWVSSGCMCQDCLM